MYRVIQLLGVRRGVAERWVQLDALTIKTDELFSNYRRCVVQARLAGADSDSYIDLAQFSARFADRSIRVSDLFIEVGSGHVETLAKKPDFTLQPVQWNDVFRAGYKVELWDRIYGNNVPAVERKDVRLTRDSVETDYRDVHAHCLFTVNGRLHYADSDQKSHVVVYDAALSRQIQGNNQMGVLSFKRIAPLKCYPITDEMISIRSGESLGDGTGQHFFTTGSLLAPLGSEQKTVMLSLGGYLLGPDDRVFQRVGPREYVIDWSAYPLLDRLFDSANCIDLSSLGLGDLSRPISRDVVHVDKVLMALLKLSQSFFIVVDTPHLSCVKTKIQQVFGSGIYRSLMDTTLPLITSAGLLSEYWKVHYEGMYTFTIANGWVQRRVLNQANIYPPGAVTSAPQPTANRKPVDAYLFQIASDYRLPA